MTTLIWVITVVIFGAVALACYLEHAHTQSALAELHQDIPPMAAQTWEAEEGVRLFAFSVRRDGYWVLQHWRAEKAVLTQEARVPAGVKHAG